MSNFDELKHIPNAIDYLADRLKDGNLVLFLGAGTSKDFGLPDWFSLVNMLRKESGLAEIAPSASSEDLQFASDEVISKINNTTKLIDLLEKYLYAEFSKLSMTDVFQNHLLVSMSALLMGSKRGHVTRVVTLNYDSMLEWFLSLFGFVVKTIYKLPALEGSEDVRIYHPHGFVPIPDVGLVSSDFIILGMDSANKRLGTIGDPWFEMTRHILDTGVCLFLGMSVNSLTDRVLEPLFTTSGQKCSGVRPLGIWILKSQINAQIEFRFGQNNIIPLSIEEPKAISEFLLKICEKAAQFLSK